MAEFAARRLRAGEQFALQHQAHADAMREQDRDEIVRGSVPDLRHRSATAIMLQSFSTVAGMPNRVLQHVGEGNVGHGA